MGAGRGQPTRSAQLGLRVPDLRRPSRLDARGSGSTGGGGAWLPAAPRHPPEPSRAGWLGDGGELVSDVDLSTEIREADTDDDKVDHLLCCSVVTLPTVAFCGHPIAGYIG